MRLVVSALLAACSTSSSEAPSRTCPALPPTLQLACNLDPSVACDYAGATIDDAGGCDVSEIRCMSGKWGLAFQMGETPCKVDAGR